MPPKFQVSFRPVVASTVQSNLIKLVSRADHKKDTPHNDVDLRLPIQERLGFLATRSVESHLKERVDRKKGSFKKPYSEVRESFVLNTRPLIFRPLKSHFPTILNVPINHGRLFHGAKSNFFDSHSFDILPFEQHKSATDSALHRERLWKIEKTYLCTADGDELVQFFHSKVSVCLCSDFDLHFPLLPIILVTFFVTCPKPCLATLSTTGDGLPEDTHTKPSCRRVSTVVSSTLVQKRGFMNNPSNGNSSGHRNVLWSDCLSIWVKVHLKICFHTNSTEYLHPGHFHKIVSEIASSLSLSERRVCFKCAKKFFFSHSPLLRCFLVYFRFRFYY